MRKSDLTAIAHILAGLLLTPCWGCGPGGTATPELIPVKGKVTYKGQPVTKGVVTFEPRNHGRTATGPLQPDGTFILGTYKDGDGVVADHHRVSVSGTGKSLKKELVPMKYIDVNSSRLTADVDRDNAEFSFDLK